MASNGNSALPNRCVSMAVSLGLGRRSEYLAMTWRVTAPWSFSDLINVSPLISTLIFLNITIRMERSRYNIRQVDRIKVTPRIIKYPTTLQAGRQTLMRTSQRRLVSRIGCSLTRLSLAACSAPSLEQPLILVRSLSPRYNVSTFYLIKGSLNSRNGSRQIL